MNDEDKVIPDVELVVHPHDEEKKAFTDKGVAKLIELMTVGDVRVEFRGQSVVLSVFREDYSIHEILKVEFSNLIASSIDWIEQSPPEEARCELYGIAGLLKEAAKQVERAARRIDEHKWRNIYIPHFIPIQDEYADLHSPKNEDDEDEEN